MNNEDKIDLLLEIVWYGIHWAEDNISENPHDGSMTTIAHQIACCICQWYNIDGVPTSETYDSLNFDNLTTKEKLKHDLVNWISLLQEDHYAATH